MLQGPIPPAKTIPAHPVPPVVSMRVGVALRAGRLRRHRVRSMFQRILGVIPGVPPAQVVQVDVPRIPVTVENIGLSLGVWDKGFSQNSVESHVSAITLKVDKGDVRVSLRKRRC